MITTTVEAPRFYSLDARLPAGVFGETYIVTACNVLEADPTLAIAEYVVLTTRAEPTRIYGRLKTHFGELGGGLGSFSPDDVHGEARTQALLDLADLLAKRAQELGRPDLEFVQLEAKPIEGRPLVGAWMRNKWHADIRWLASNVLNTSLGNYCKLIKLNVKGFGPVPLDD